MLWNQDQASFSQKQGFGRGVFWDVILSDKYLYAMREVM